jgi:hypothetical protein
MAPIDHQPGPGVEEEDHHQQQYHHQYPTRATQLGIPGCQQHCFPAVPWNMAAITQPQRYTSLTYVLLTLGHSQTLPPSSPPDSPVVRQHLKQMHARSAWPVLYISWWYFLSGCLRGPWAFAPPLPPCTTLCTTPPQHRGPRASKGLRRNLLVLVTSPAKP